jgi:erythromycin esterase
MHRSHAVLALAIVTTLPVTRAAAQQTDGRTPEVANPSFERVDAEGPAGWTVMPGGDVTVDTALARDGRRSLRVRRSGNSGGPGVSQSFPAGMFVGDRLRLSGWIRTDSIANGQAAFWLRVDGVEYYLAMDNMQGRGPSGRTEWQRYEVVVPVEEGARRIVFGAIVSGAGTAWFDGLALERLEGVAAPAGDDVAGVGGALLDDAAMRVDAGEPLPPGRAAWAEWVRANAQPIRSLTSEDFSDLRFLATLLEGRRVVQLGENGHGVSEFNHVKVRLIKYLHEELGYDVIAFESALWECWRTNGRVAELAAAEIMRGCIFGVWHADETVELFRYIRETRNTARPLILAGFDTQISAGRAAAKRPDFFRRLLAPLDSAYAERAAAGDSALVAGMSAYAQENRAALLAFYDSLETFLATRGAGIARAARVGPIDVSIARQTAWSMQRYVEQLTAGGAPRTLARDEGMAKNLDFLLDSVFPGRKIITWGHNFHLRHRNSAVSPDPVKTMGEWVAERRRDELYTVGLYMRSGRATLNNRVPYDVAPMAAISLENIVAQAGLRYAFIDFSRAPQVPGNEWMRTSIPAKTWGRTDVFLVPAEQYDAVLVIDETRPPRYR